MNIIHAPRAGLLNYTGCSLQLACVTAYHVRYHTPMIRVHITVARYPELYIFYLHVARESFAVREVRPTHSLSLCVIVVRSTLPSINLFPRVRAAAALQRTRVRLPLDRARPESPGMFSELSVVPRNEGRSGEKEKIQKVSSYIYSYNTRVRSPLYTASRHWFSKTFRASRRVFCELCGDGVSSRRYSRGHERKKTTQRAGQRVITVRK